MEEYDIYKLNLNQKQSNKLKQIQQQKIYFEKKINLIIKQLSIRCKNKQNNIIFQKSSLIKEFNGYISIQKNFILIFKKTIFLLV